MFTKSITLCLLFSEVTINTNARLSNGDAAKRKSIFGSITRIPASAEPKKLSKFDLLTQGMDLENSNKAKNDESIKKVVAAATEKDDHGAKKEEVKDESSDSEYETEEVYELREWYPPDFWRAKDQDSANRVCQTDVTANNLTVTMLESRVCDGFFKAL